MAEKNQFDNSSVVVPIRPGNDQDSLPPSGGGPYDGGMDVRITALETKLDSVMPTLSTKADLADLKSELHKMDASIKTWMMSTVIGMFVGFAGLIFTLGNSLKPGASSLQSPAPVFQSTPAPIIINVPSSTTAPLAIAAPSSAQSAPSRP